MNIQIFSIRLSSFVELVNYWSQILGYVIYACNDHKIRRKIVMNLIDENCGKLTHVETFYQFLVECGFKGSLQSIKSNFIVLKHHNLLQSYMTKYSFEQCCAILGSIEYIYHIISGEINKYFEEAKGYQPSNHYTIHELLDVQHATDLFDCSNEVALTNDLLDIGANWIIGCMSELLDFKPVFGYTYEDSDIENLALAMLENVPENCLIILSGGDTMFDLAGKITNLTAVDMNLGQVKLVKEKIKHLKEKSYQKFLEELETKQIVYDNLFCKLKNGDSFENVFDAELLKKRIWRRSCKKHNKKFCYTFS